MRGNPIRLIPLSDMVAYTLEHLTRTPASSDLGRTLQLLKAAKVLESTPVGQPKALPPTPTGAIVVRRG